jgi:hypothetical protein
VSNIYLEENMKQKFKLIGIVLILCLIVTITIGDQLNLPFKSEYTEIKVAGDDLPIYIGMSIPMG